MPTQTFFQQLTHQVRDLLGFSAALLMLDCPEPALRHPLLRSFLPAGSLRCYGSTHLNALLRHERVRALCDVACQRGHMQSINDCRIPIDAQDVAWSVAIAPIETLEGILAFLLLVDGPAGGFSQGEEHLLHSYLQTIALACEQAVRTLCSAHIDPGLITHQGPAAETGNDVVDGLKSEIVSIVSHELRAPLTAIKGYASLLQAYGVRDCMHGNNYAIEMTPARQQRYLDTILEQTNHLEILIADLLDISRIQTGKLSLNVTQVDVGPLCQQAMRFAQQRIEQQQLERHYLRCELSPDLPPILADPHRLQQILNNLLDNAIKYSPGGGLIEIHACSVPLSPSGVSMLQIVVRDQGIGIAEQHHARLFLPFSRLHHPVTSQVQGAGLGLYITRQLVEAMDGEIELASREGEGTTVVLRFPGYYPGVEHVSKHSRDFSLRKS